VKSKLGGTKVIVEVAPIIIPEKQPSGAKCLRHLGADKTAGVVKGSVIGYCRGLIACHQVRGPNICRRKTASERHAVVNCMWGAEPEFQSPGLVVYGVSYRLRSEGRDLEVR
jgi:hypothetical protein